MQFAQKLFCAHRRQLFHAKLRGYCRDENNIAFLFLDLARNDQSPITQLFQFHLHKTPYAIAKVQQKTPAPRVREFWNVSCFSYLISIIPKPPLTADIIIPIIIVIPEGLWNFIYILHYAHPQNPVNSCLGKRKGRPPCGGARDPRRYTFIASYVLSTCQASASEE